MATHLISMPRLSSKTSDFWEILGNFWGISPNFFQKTLADWKFIYICSVLQMSLLITQGRRKQPTTYRGLFFLPSTSKTSAVALREKKPPRGGSHLDSSVTATAFLLPKLKCYRYAKHTDDSRTDGKENTGNLPRLPFQKQHRTDRQQRP